MPRGPVVYTLPAGTTPKNPLEVVPSALWNGAFTDIANTFNTVQPIEYGGTNAATAAGARTNLGLAIGTDIPSYAQVLNPANIALAATVAGNALTIALKGVNGSDPSASNIVNIPFRDVNPATGIPVNIAVTAATSLVISPGSTLGTANGIAAALAVVGFNDAGTFRLGIVNPTAFPLIDSIASSTAEGGAGAADSAGVYYTGTAVASKAYTVLGYVNITEAAAGTWATAPTVTQVTNSAQWNNIAGKSGVRTQPSVATTSGTAINLTGIPPGSKRVTLQILGVSQNSASQNVLVRLGTAAGVESTGYAAAGGFIAGAGTVDSAAQTTGFPFSAAVIGAAATFSGSFVLTRVGSTNQWVCFAQNQDTVNGQIHFGGGDKTLVGELDRLQLTTAGGTAAFDAGSVAVIWEF